MEKRHYHLRSGLFLLGATLAIAIVIASYLAATTVKQVIIGKGTISVKGYAERKITSDHAIWQGNFVVRSSSLIEAYTQLEKDLKVILAYLNQQGVKAEELKISPIYTSINYKLNEKGGTTHQIDGYVLSREFKVSSSDVSKITRLSGEISNLIKDGVEVSSYAPQYFFTQIDALKVEMLGDAAKDAYSRAKQLINKSSGEIGDLRSAQQGVFQITPDYSTSTSDYGENDTSSIEKSIKAVVKMEYGINPL